MQYYKPFINMGAYPLVSTYMVLYSISRYVIVLDVPFMHKFDVGF